MSLFPAYGPPGRDRGTNRDDSGTSRRSAGRGDHQAPPLFIIDRDGDDRRIGGAADPIIIGDDEEEGEVRDTPPDRQRSSSDLRKRDSKKRKRSRSKSPKHKRKKERRSRSRSPRRRRKDEESSQHHEYDRRGGAEQRAHQYQNQGRRDEEYERGNYGGRDRGKFSGENNERGFDREWQGQGHGGGDRRGWNNYPEKGNDGRNSYRDRGNDGGRGRGRDQYYENQRLDVAQRFPKKIFLEEVNLKPEFAFRIDTAANNRHLDFPTLGKMQKSFYEYTNNIKVMGASEQDLAQIYNKFSKFRCILPKEVEHIEEENSNTSWSKPVKEAQRFISISKDKGKNNERIDLTGAFETLSFPRKEGELTVKEQIENYNKRVRDEPRNIALWKEFIQFQDKYFEENERLYTVEDRKDEGGRKKRRNKKALLEKKVAIVEKALESNPKHLELHMMRLNYLCTLKPPDVVLDEWKQLVSGNQKVTPFWIEYFRFASTQLQVFSTSRVTEIVQKSFNKFRQMLSPSFPEFQRPTKFLLVLNDILHCLSLVLRNAGFREKALALHQAQLELDFFPPKDKLKSESLIEWKENKKMFEFFWDAGTAKFGEKNAPGWSNYIQDMEKHTQRAVIGISDTKHSDFEDKFVEVLNEDENAKSTNKARHWLFIESNRSKFQWLPWRAKCSDVDEIVDSNRIVLGQDISSFIVPIPNLNYVSELNKQSAYFRHIVNLILMLQEDFIPQTHCVSCVLNPFTAVSLTESRSLFSELFYWRRLLNLYVPEDDISGRKEEKEEVPKPLMKTPEGFRVQDWTSPNTFAFKCDVGRKPIYFDLKNDDRIENIQNSILVENQSNLLSMIRTVVDKAVDILQPPFASLLMEMYLRFEQKHTIGSRETRKERLKHAKNFIQKTSLRNSMSAYLEMGMLEYFEGNRKGATSLLIKTINLGVENLIQPDDITGYVDVETNWENVTELTKLYTRLAEFHLNEKPQLAYYILSLLGSGFKPVNLELEDASLTVTNVMLLRATRHFEKVLGQIMPGLEDGAVVDTVFPLSKEMLGRWDGENCVDYILQKSNLIVEWTKAYAMFKFFSKEQDFSVASEVYEQALQRIEVPQALCQSGNYDEDVIIRHHIREQLYISWCNLGAFVLSKNPMANSKFRGILGQALGEFPSSPPLLLLFTDVENQMSIAGKLWRMMVGIVKQDGACNHWTPLFMGIGLAKKIEDLEHDEEIGLSSFGLGGPAVPPDTIFYKLDSLLTAAQENGLTKNCPLIWRVHLKLLALRTLQGKDVQRAKATFYEAIRQCPSAKPLYLDGILYFPELLKEVTNLMDEKQLYTRLPVEELDVLLEIEDEQRDDEKIITVSSDEN